MRKNKLNFAKETFLTNKKIFFIFLLLGFLINFTSFNAPFIWDDEVVIQSNNLIKDFKNIFSVFKYDFFGERINPSTQFYRPVTNLSFFIDYLFSGENPFFYHLSNTILHILNSYLVYLILFKLLLNQRLAFYSALLFLISPSNIFTSSYISNRTVLLGSFLAYLAFLYFIKEKSGKSFLFFVLALFAKEDFVVLPFIFLLYYAFFRYRDKYLLKNLLPFLLTSIF